MIRFTLAATMIALMISCSVSRNLDREFKREFGSQNFHSGLVVYDTKNKRELINQNGAKYFTPCSNVKLFTFYTAWRTFKEMDSVPGLAYFRAGDSLILSGTADPSLLYIPSALGPLDFLRKTEGKLFLEYQELEDQVYGPGWSWEDYRFGFMAEKSSMPLYGNRVHLEPRNDTLTVTPRIFENHLRMTDESGLSRAQHENMFYLPETGVQGEQEVPFITSGQLTADLLSEELGRKVTLLPSQGTSGDFDLLYSIPYDSLYTRMLQQSDNFIAEQLMLQVSRRTSGDFHVKKAISHALEEYLTGIPQQPKWVDGSGLSRYNLFTPESLVYLLEKMYREVPHERLFSILPVMGKSGTLKYGFSDDPPPVYAKSGSFSNNYSLSGYLLTKKGNVLIFSFMNNHFQDSSAQRKKVIQELLTTLYEQY